MDMLTIGEKSRYEDVYNLTHHTYIKNEGNDVQRMWICWLASNPNILVTDWSRIPEKDCLLTLRLMLAIALNRHDVVEHLINDVETKKHQFTPPEIAALIGVLHFEWAHINESIWNRMAHWLNDLLPAAEYIAQLTTATNEKRLTSLLVCLEQFYKILNDPKDLDIKKVLSSNGCVPRAKLSSVLLAGEQFCLMAVTTHNFNLLPLIAENCPTLYDNAWKNKSSVNESPVSGPAVSPMK